MSFSRLRSMVTFKTKKTGNVAVCFLGDGASNQGTTAESINMASILKLPAIFVVEDNGYAEATSSDYSVGGNIVDRGKAYGLHAEKVDGTDFFAVHQAAKEAVERAKNNEGPTLLHVKLSRVYGHYEGDAITYRLDEETKDIVNEKVKHRQWFRPFAPSITREDVKDWFEKDVDSPYMTAVIKFKEEMRDKVPAVVHFDGTARLQTVTAVSYTHLRAHET